MPLKSDTYNTKNIFALCIIGLVIKVMFGNSYTQDGSNGPASSALWGYGLASMAIFFLMFVQTHHLVKTNNGTSKLQQVYAMLSNILPTLLMFIVLSWLVILNYQYYNQINTGKVASEYNQFSNMSTVMVLFQMAILFKYIYANMQGDSNGEEASKYSSVSYLVGILNIVFIGMMNIIILSFSTDG